MCQMTSISKNPKIHNFLKDPPRLYAHFLQDITDPEPLNFPQNGEKLESLV